MDPGRSLGCRSQRWKIVIQDSGPAVEVKKSRNLKLQGRPVNRTQAHLAGFFEEVRDSQSESQLRSFRASLSPGEIGRFAGIDIHALMYYCIIVLRYKWRGYLENHAVSSWRFCISTTLRRAGYGDAKAYGAIFMKYAKLEPKIATAWTSYFLMGIYVTRVTNWKSRSCNALVVQSSGDERSASARDWSYTWRGDVNKNECPSRFVASDADISTAKRDKKLR